MKRFEFCLHCAIAGNRLIGPLVCHNFLRTIVSTKVYPPPFGLYKSFLDLSLENTTKVLFNKALSHGNGELFT